MKIYVAAPWVRKQDAIAAAEQFKAAGFEITSRWLSQHEGDPNDPTGLSSPVEHIREQAREDWQDVLDSDVVVVLNLERSEGKAVETGIALVSGIPVLCVGPRSNIFQTLGLGMVYSVEEAIQFLQTVPIPAVA